MAQGGGAGPNAGVLFQASVGGLFAASLLAGAVLPAAIRLGAAKARTLKFETEAPVDDILVATDDDGYIAIQAKTTVRASRRLDSPFGKTIEQFVRHWLVCRDGDGGRGWNRPLDAARDRLVLAAGPESSASVLKDLPSALRARSDPGAAILTEAEQQVLNAFDEVVVGAWASITSETPPDSLVADLSRLVAVLAIDPDAPVPPGILAPLLIDPDHSSGVDAKLRVLMGEWMRDRRGGDAADVKNELERRGVRFDTPPDYREDIAKLKVHSAATARALHRFEEIDAGGQTTVSVPRDCQPAVDAAAEAGSLLIVGEPGAGKSGVLSALATGFKARGREVFELAVDRHSVETLEGLSASLGLTHPLIEVLKAWDAPEGRWLVIDALDAARGGGGQEVFRDLIERVLTETRHWRVVATIRTFDLRLGRQFRALFKDVPPDSNLVETGLDNVRHIRIPPWSDVEFERLRREIPPLDAVLTAAGPKLSDLARVPFNTRLLADLVAEGQDQLVGIETQVELLARYWEHRVEELGLPARAVLRRLVERMVRDRVLQAPVDLFDPTSAEILAALSRNGIVIEIAGGRRIQFRHHLLFDYAASRTYLDPDALLGRPGPFPKADAPGLMLAPAVTFLLHELWSEAASRNRFWSAITNLATDQEADPVIRSVAGRAGISHPVVAADVEVLASRVCQGDAQAVEALGQLVGALAVRLEDDPAAPLGPWSRLAARLAEVVHHNRPALHGLVFLLAPRVKAPDLRAETGLAARALLAYAIDGDHPASGAINFVVDTFDTDPSASKDLLRRLFGPTRFAGHGWEDVPALAYKIAAITEHDPAFTGEIYTVVYAREVAEETETSLGHSQILALRSTARQDFDMARYSLTEHFPAFVEMAPLEAASALAQAVEGFVAREHAPTSEVEATTLSIDGYDYLLKADLSYIWAHDVDKAYGHDADALMVKFIAAMEAAPEGAALQMVQCVARHAVHAVVWSRLLLIGARRGDSVADFLWPFAVQELFLVTPDTRKDAIDLIARIASRRSPSERASLETAAFDFGFEDFQYPAEAREGLLVRLFSAIGTDHLQTVTARDFLSGRQDEEVAENNRLYRVSSWTGGAIDDFHWIPDLDKDDPDNASLISVVRPVRERLGLDRHGAPTPLEFSAAINELVVLETVLSEHPGAHPRLRCYVEGAIGQGLNRALRSETFSAETQTLATATRLLTGIADANSPEPDPEAEARFARSPSWSSPAPRVDAAEALPELAHKAPTLWPTLRPTFERLLADPYPAVRMQAATRLLRLWNIEPDTVWSLLTERLQTEENVAVIDYVVAGVLAALVHQDPGRVEGLALSVYARFPEPSDGLEGHLANIIAILAVTHQRDAAMAMVEQWTSAPAEFSKPLHKVLMTLREALVIGLRPDDAQADRAIRFRAQAVYAQAVDAAARVFDEAPPAPWDDAWTARLRAAAQTLDIACRELYFAIGGSRSDGEAVRLAADARGTFLTEAAPIMRRIGDRGTPHTIHYLLQTLEPLVRDGPETTFDLVAHALLNGGRGSGYAFESLGADLAVKLIGVFLADHRDIFTPDRRRVLVDCLETFIDAGWPAARRLLYDLPELLQ